MFANKYLEKNNRKTLIPAKPNAELGISVVIPCFQEPDILSTLESLNSCELTRLKVEVIVVVNHSELASNNIKQFNIKTKNEVENWILNHKNHRIDFFVVGPVELQKKWAGAGLARKCGMDEAASRFNRVEKPDGIIVSLDADTLVDKNYLFEIEIHFKQNPGNVGATILFQHQTLGLGDKHLEGIQLYEKYLVYYKRALDFTGYPYSMFTVGSAFAVKAGAYVKRGGMNRKKAGEDFYFLQNLVQLGKVGEITSTKVYPSARLSNRVPFGTGPILQKWMKGEGDLTQAYNFKAFVDLKAFFDLKNELYQIDEEGFNQLIFKFPNAVQNFIIEDNFRKEIDDLNQNCSSLQTFQIRFFHKFNAFKILKFLNFAHSKYYKKEDLYKQITALENKRIGKLNE